MVAQRDEVQTGGALPGQTFSFPRYQVCSVKVCIIMSIKVVSFDWVLVMKCMLQFPECLNIVNCINSFLSGQEVNQYTFLCSSNKCFSQ